MAVKVTLKIESKHLDDSTIERMLWRISIWGEMLDSWWLTNAITMGNHAEYGDRKGIARPEIKVKVTQISRETEEEKK